MSSGRAFHWLMAVAAFVLPAGLVSGQRPEAIGKSVIASSVDRPAAQAVLFRHYV